MKVLVVGVGRARARDRPRAARARRRRPELLARARQPGHRARRARCLTVAVDDLDGLVALARAEGVDLVVIGPEAPLVAGLADRLERRGHRALRPERRRGAAGGLQGVRQGGHGGRRRPDGRSGRRSTTVEEGMAAIDGRYPAVIKFDGLAAGKGVVDRARRGDGARGAGRDARASAASATAPVVVEEFLDGEELSLFAICDGERAVPMVPAQDYKRIFDGDEGPNTGGMGAYRRSPARRTPTRSSRRSTSRSSTCCASAARRSTASSTPG